MFKWFWTIFSLGAPEPTTTTSKNNRFHEQNNSSARASSFLVHFFDVRWWRTWTCEDEFSFSLFIKSLRIQLQKKSSTFDKLSGYNSRALVAVCRHFFLSCASLQADLDEGYSPKTFFLFNCKLYLKWPKFLYNFTACLTGFQWVAACSGGSGRGAPGGRPSP